MMNPKIIFVEDKVNGWVECVFKLAAAKKSPQQHFFAVKKSL